MTTPVIACHDHVALRSEPLDELWWQGRQWAVTSFGIECRDGTYTIQASRLYERNYCNGQLCWSWPLHLAGKGWADIHDFCTAFAVALAMHSRPSKAKPYSRGEVAQTCSDAIDRLIHFYGRAA